MISEGDEDAFNEFYDRLLPDFTDYIFITVKSEYATKEVIQEALTRLWIYRDKLADVEHPRPWFFKIVANECFRYLHKHGLQQSRMELTDTPLSNLDNRSLNQTEQEVSFRETRHIIQQTLASLSPRQRMIYRMSREQGLKLEEIAKELGLSRDYIKKTLMLALRIVRQKLQEAGRFISVVALLLVEKNIF